MGHYYTLSSILVAQTAFPKIAIEDVARCLALEKVDGGVEHRDIFSCEGVSIARKSGDPSLEKGFIH